MNEDNHMPPPYSPRSLTVTHQNGKEPNFIFYNYCESQINWESQASTKNSTEFHTANNSKNFQTKGMNQIFVKSIESETEISASPARLPLANTSTVAPEY